MVEEKRGEGTRREGEMEEQRDRGQDGGKMGGKKNFLINLW